MKASILVLFGICSLWPLSSACRHDSQLRIIPEVEVALAWRGWRRGGKWAASWVSLDGNSVIMFLMWCVFSYWQLINSRYLKHHYKMWVFAHSTLGSLILIFTIVSVMMMGIEGLKGFIGVVVILLLLTLATTGTWILCQKCSSKRSQRPYKVLQWIHRVISQ